jgi:hypothetical protein
MYAKKLLSGLAALFLALITVPIAHADYSNTVMSFNPLGYWRLSQTTQPPIADVATNLGTLGTTGFGYYVGNFTRPVTGALVGSPDTAASFDGSSGHVGVPYSPALGINAPFTVEAWVNPAVVTANALTCVLACGEFAGNRSGWLIYQDGGSGYRFRLYNQNGGTFSLDLLGGSTPVAGNWYHVVAVYNGTTATIYVNGVGTSANPSGFVANTDAPLRIGIRSDVGFPFNGSVDEVAIYTNALTSAEVLSHYQNGTSASPSTPYNQLVLAKNPLIYQRLNESVYTAPDPSTLPSATNSGSLGTNADGLFQPGSVAGVAGPAFSGLGANNKAAKFNGVAGYVDCGTAPELNIIGPMSVIAWIRGNPADARFQTVLGKGDSSWRMSLDGQGRAGYAFGNSPDAIGTRNINDGQWHQMVGVNDGVNNYIYVDGVLNGTSAASGTVAGNAGSLFIGNVPDNLLSRDFAGSIDEVAVFTNSFTAAQVQQIYFSANVPPYFYQQPPSPGTVNEGVSLTVGAVAIGSPTLGYQWTKGGAIVAGQTTATLTLNNVHTNDGGAYALVATNAYGAATSSIVTLTVQAGPPIILQQPLPNTRYTGASVTFSAKVTGSAPLSYQWKLNGTTVITGATSSSYTIANVQAVNAGNYSCTMVNAYGSTNTTSVPLTVLSTPTSLYAQTILADNPVGYWRLGETNGTVAHDYLNGLDGVFTNVALGQAGYSVIDPDKAVGFGPVINSYVSNIPVDFAPLGTNATFSVEAWVKGAPQVNDSCIITKGTGAGGEQFNLDAGNGGKFRWFVRDAGSGNQAHLANGSIAPDGNWHHLVGVCDMVNGQVILYVDGVADANTTVSGGLMASTKAMTIGSRQSGAATPFDLNWTGTIDEVAVYSNALSPSQVAAHFNARYGSSTPPAIRTSPTAATNYPGLLSTFSVDAGGTDPVTYQWQFNGVDISGATSNVLTISPLDATNAGNYSVRISNSFGTTNSSAGHLTVLAIPTAIDLSSGLVMHLKFDGDYADYSGRGNNGTNVGATTFVSGKIGSNAVHYFTDTSVSSYNYVALGLRPDLQFGSNVNFSVAYWIKLPAGAVPGDLPFLCNAVGSTFSQGYTFAPTYKTGGWAWSVYGPSTGVGALGPDATINDGNWHHLAHTFDRNGYALTYLDGIQVDQSPIANVGNIDTGKPTNIGQDPTGTYDGGGPAEADVDDMGVWRRVLTPLEVAGMYVAGNSNGVSFASARVKITIQVTGSQVKVTWPAGILQSATEAAGPYTDVTGATSPLTVTASGARKFYRVRQ